MKLACAISAVILGCVPAARPPDRPPLPSLPHLPADSTFTVARPGRPRAELLYYRNILGIIFDDTTSGATIRALLPRYGATIFGGVPGDAEYIVQIADPGPAFSALEAVVTRIDAEPGVALARKVYYRAPFTIDGQSGAYMVTGRLVDREQRVPVAAGFVRVAPAGVEAQSDSAGVFRLRLAAPAGCHLLRTRRIGYGPTALSVALGQDTLVDVGDVPLRGAAIPETRTLFVPTCRLPDSVQVGGKAEDWGAGAVDTMRRP